MIGPSDLSPWSMRRFDPNETSGMIAAAQALILIGENGGDPMFADIATIRAFRPRAEGGTCTAP